MTEFVQGLRYGLMAVGWVMAFGVGTVVLICIGAALTALGDWLNGKTGESGDGEDE